jgi:antitoxin (DNA-binding transcriptional repressor) of toxin-antitoxin stability system
MFGFAVWRPVAGRGFVLVLYSWMYTCCMELNATEVRRRILSLLDTLPGEGIVITKRGKALARLVPIGGAGKGSFVTGPMVPSRGKPGPLCPTTETPYDLLLD